MDKKEYLSKRSELQRQLAELKEEYIKTNSPIKPMTKVKVIDRYDGQEKLGILLGYSCRWDDVEPIVAKMNKDGSPHANARLYVGCSKVVEA